MTNPSAPIYPAPEKRLTPRLRRLAAVVGLCAVVLPIAGFWAGGNDPMRGIAAVRMRLDHKAETPAESASPPDRVVPDFVNRSGLPASHTSADAGIQQGILLVNSPITLDKARYRATLRDIPAAPANSAPLPGERNQGTKSFISLYNNQVVLALADATYIPLRRISKSRPSQTYSLWAENTSFLPADGRHRNADPTDSRWLTDTNWELGGSCKIDAQTALAEDMQRLLLRIRAPFYAKQHPKSAQYMEFITHSAQRFGLSPQLIYAIMRTESAFNPFAVSNAGALGLMQVVPESAGNEVRTYLTGVAEKPTTAMLFDPKNNIEYGCAYLHLLATRYFSGVSNQTSRELCMIAGYNAGPRAVLRVFSPNTEDAVTAINALTPEELFQVLTRKMPAEETRQYLGKVLSAVSSYPG